MAETIKGINVVIGADTSGLGKALSDVNKRSRDIQTELRQVDRLLKLDPKNTELLAQKQKLLGEAVAVTREKLDRLRAVQEQVNEQFARGEISEGQYRAFQREVEATEIRLKELEKQAGTTKKSLEEIGKSMQETGKKISDAGGTLTKGVTVPLAAVGGASLKAASDFESAFAGVRKTVDATEEEFAVFKQGMRDMAKEMPQAATEIARVGEAAGQLGIQNEAILGFTETMVNLGVATNMSSDDAAMALARFANITQMSQQDFDRLGSSVVGLGNNFAATEEEIVDMALRLAGAGAQIGMSEADILGLAASLSSVGIQAEMGGSAMSRVMVRMQVAASTGLGKVQELSEQTGMSLREMQLLAANNAGDFKGLADSLGMTAGEMNNIVKAGVDLENFGEVAGMTAEEFKQAFEVDAVGALGSFINGLGNAEEAGESAINMLQEMGITEIRLRDSLLRAGNANELFANAVEIANTAWEENTALTDEAQERYKTLESRMQILWNRIKDVGITLGDALIPAMIAAMEAMQPLIDMLARMTEWFANLDPGMQRFIIIVAGLALAIGPVLAFIGKLITSIGAIIGVVSKVGAAIKAAGGIIGGFKVVLAALTGPIGLVVAAVAALAAGAFLVIKNWDSIKEFFANLWESIVTTTGEVWETIKEALSAAWEAITNVATTAWEGIANFFTTIWESITTFLKTTWNNLKNIAKTAFEAVVNVVKPIFEGFRTFFTGIWEVIKNIFAGALLLLINLVTGNFTELKKNAEAIWNNLKEAFVKIWEGIKQVFFGTLEAIKTVVTTSWNFIKSTTINIINGIMTWIKTTWDKLLDWFRELPSKLYTIGSDMFNRMKDAVTTTVTTVKDAIVTGITAAIDWLKQLPAQMMKIGKDMIQGLVDGIKNMVGAVGDAIKDIADKVTGGIKDFLNIQSPSRVMMALGEDTGEGFALGIRNKISDVQGKARDMAAATTNALRGVTTPSVGITGHAGAGGISNTYTFAGMFAGANFQVRNDMDIEHIADAVAVRFQGKVQRNTRGLGRG